MNEVLIIEDEIPAVHLLENFIKQRNDLLLKFVAKNSSEAENFLKSNEVNLIILDLNIPGKTGLELIASLDTPAHFIIISARSDLAINGLNMGAVDYLLKPVTLQRFNQAVDRFIKISHSSSENSAPRLTFFEKKNKCMVSINDIHFFEKRDRNILIHTENKVYQSRKSLNEFLKMVENHGFMQIHRQFIVNNKFVTQKIHQGSGNYILRLSDPDDSEIPIGRTYLSKLKDHFNQC